MSVIQKQPFIEKVIASLSDEEKVALVSLINGGDLEPDFRSLINKTYNLSASDKGVSHIILETLERTYTGYLLYTDTYCVLVSYKNIQELVMLDINPTKNTYELVKEPLTITELRFELGASASGGGAGNVKAENIDSESATSGQVLTADGQGGASWQNTIPTVTIALAQITSQSPLTVQLTNEQYDIFANNKQVLLDLSALGENTIIWTLFAEDSSQLIFACANGVPFSMYFNITIDKTTKEAVYNTGSTDVLYDQIMTDYASSDMGKLISIGSNGHGQVTNNLPILTTAPTSANTEGGVIIVVLDQEPATYYNGYLYLIQEAVA